MNSEIYIRNIAIFMLLSFVSIALGDGWRIETIIDGNSGYTSIAIDSNNNPHISYHYTGSGVSIRYAWWDGDEWQIESVDTATTGAVRSSIALDSSDYPHISYYDASNGDLKYAYWDGSDWQIEAAHAGASPAGFWNSIAIDSNDQPHIAYSIGTSDDLWYCNKTTVWNRWYVDTPGNVGDYCSVAVDSNDYGRISYYDESNSSLKCAKWNGAAWVKDIVDNTGYMGMWSSIAIDTSDYTHISYHDDGNDNLRYAYEDVSGWNTETAVSSTQFVGYYTSIELDSTDYPHISYYSDSSNYDLEYVSWDGSNWNVETIDTTGHPGQDNSIGLDSTDNPHISYRGSNSQLKYAFYNIAPGTFDLLSPGDGDTVYEPVTLDWEDSDDGGQHTVTFDLWYSTDSTFATYDEINDLTDSTYTFSAGTFDDLTIYYWKVVASDGYEETWSGPDGYWSFYLDDSTSVDGDTGNLPTTFALHSAVPNPSDGSATIGYALPKSCEVELSLYDIKGRKIGTLVSGSHQPGEYSADVSGLSSGVYIYEIKADEFVSSKKMVVR